MSHRRKLKVSNVTVNLGCGSCSRTSRLLSNIFHPKSKPVNKPLPSFQKAHNPSYSSTSSWQTADTSTYYSDSTDSDIRSLRAVQGFGKIGGESLAVEKDSEDPYLDFRQSMLQMILENEIYSKNDLKELLNCFLQLNSPYHHGIIVRAFTEIWNGVYTGRAGSSSNMHGGHGSRDY
ncbi:hypothetical protein AgCh_007846 [Apium graveolens]